MKLLESLFKDEDTDYGNLTCEQSNFAQESKPFSWWFFLACVLVFLLALAARWYFIFKVGHPENAGLGWYGDTFHRWQIAYLTKEIGFGKGFLRLWDLKGMEYFWGILHPLITVPLFYIFSSTNMLILRFTSVVFGCFSCVWLTILGHRYWNWWVGLAAGLFMAFFPVAVFNDATGSLEPIGISFLLAGICCWPKAVWATGLLWALSAMSRAEAWLFSAGLVFASFLSRGIRFDKKVILAVFWLIPMLIYMKILLDRTGNPIYPVWWNFLANAKGEWENASGHTEFQLKVQPYYLAAAIISVPFLIHALVTRSKNFLLSLFGWGNILFVGVMMGATAYLKSVVPYFWMIRFFVWPYTFIGISIIWFFGGGAPRFLSRFSKVLAGISTFFGIALFVAMIFCAQLLWPSITNRYLETDLNWGPAWQTGRKIASFYLDGKFLYPESATELLYFIVQSGGDVKGNILSQMYDPFAYEPFSEYKDSNRDFFVSWHDDKHLVLDWIRKERISLLAVPADGKRYRDLILLEPWLFTHLEEVRGYGVYDLYKVNWEKI